VRIRSEAPGPEAPAAEFSYALTGAQLKSSFDETSDAFRLAVAAGSFAEILRGSPHMAEISLLQVGRIAKGAAREEYPEDAELVGLIDRAAELRGEKTYTQR
jgi:hypothetical protein